MALENEANDMKNPPSNLATPRNNLDYMLFDGNKEKSPFGGVGFGMSPHSSNINPFDSFHSFDGSLKQGQGSTQLGDSFKDNNSFAGSNTFKWPTANPHTMSSVRQAEEEMVPVIPSETENRDAKDEREIMKVFNKYVHNMSKSGALKGISNSSLLNSKNKLTDSSIFKCSIVSEEDSLEPSSQ